MEDTLLVPTAVDANNHTISHRVDVYTRYSDYIGKFVLHCHILGPEPAKLAINSTARLHFMLQSPQRRRGWQPVAHVRLR